MHNAIPAKHTLARGLMLALLLTGACYPFKRDAPYPKKQVTAKEGISVLISNTARCLVPTKDFPKVQVGQMWACNWKDVGATTLPRAAAAR